MIGVDWGTTHLRAYQIGLDGSVVASRSTPKGILPVSDGNFFAALESAIGDWLDAESAPILMSGMIGSGQGWLEAPYVARPATPAAIAEGLAEATWGKGRRGFICPGLTCRDSDGAPDVVRGEEVQAFGALALQAQQPATSDDRPSWRAQQARRGRGGRRERVCRLHDRRSLRGPLPAQHSRSDDDTRAGGLAGV